jgi:hypothetical protein
MKIRIVKWANSNLENSVLNKLNITNGAVFDTKLETLFADIMNAEPDIAVMLSHEHSPEFDATFYISERSGFHHGSKEKRNDLF